VATLREKGAGYVHRENIKDPYTKGALDDISSQVQAIRRQGNYTALGSPSPPSAPNSLAVSAQNGLVTVAINHPGAPPSTKWILYYSTSPTFQNAIEVELGRPFFQQYLPQQTLYFKATAKLAASNETSPVYLESSPGILQAVATGISQ
jgi:hypothetical protein